MICHRCDVFVCLLYFQVNEHIGLSPSVYTQRQSQRLQKKRKAAKANAATLDAKRRRSELKGQRGKQELSRHVREGVTYATGIEQVASIADITEIPQHKEASNSDNLVFIDLETTGLGRDPDIIQLSAVSKDKELNRYICPNKPISPEASRVTGFTLRNGQLHLRGQPVRTVTMHQALVDLLEFTQSGSSVLIGHNIRSYDIPILYRFLRGNTSVCLCGHSTSGT